MRRVLCICLAILLFLGMVTPMALAETAPVFRTEPMVSVGSGHTVALRSDGTVWAWGSNGFGELGDNTVKQHHIPVQIQGLTNVVAVSAGAWHIVALRSDGTVWTWGWNDVGQLGDGTKTNRYAPVQVQNLTNVVAVSANLWHTVALRSDGTVWTWGENGAGQLGDGTTTERLTPIQVRDLENVTAVSAGPTHVVALRNDGTVWAWGSNEFGKLGNGTMADRHTPVQVQTLTNAIAVSAGSWYTVALRSDGTVWAWGGNWLGTLGDGTTTDRLMPVQVQDLTNVATVLAGGTHTVALRSDGTVWTWGDHSCGQLGDGTQSGWGIYSTIPVQPQITNVVAISASEGNTAVLRDDGTVWTWGNNLFGQLGDGTATSRYTPTQVLGPDGVGFLNLGAGPRFIDVPLHAWFHDAVEFVHDQGIMSGTSPTTFAPNANFSREMVIATLFRMYHGRLANSMDARDTPFADVDADRWYAPYIAWGYEQGIVTGTSPTTFGIGNPVSRQDFAVFLHRFARFTGVDIEIHADSTLTFPDADSVGSWAKEALTWAVYAGLITGTGQGLEPTGTATRAQAATILMRYVQVFVE